MVVNKSAQLYVRIFIVLVSCFSGVAVGVESHPRNPPSDFVDLNNRRENVSETRTVTNVNGSPQNLAQDGPVSESLQIDVTHGSAVTPVKVGDNVSPAVMLPRKYRLPTSWNNFCEVDSEVYESIFTKRTNLTSIDCVIDQQYSGIWSLTDLRKNLELYEDTDTKFSINIKCLDMANVSLPWPFKAKNVYKLQVEGCQIVDFMAEKGSQIIENIPDTLRVLHLRNSILVISIARFVHMMKTIADISKEFDCQHEDTVEDLSVRNVSYDYIMDYTVSSLTDIGRNFLLNTSRIDHTCDFKHLLHVDEGHSPTMSLYHMDLVTQNGIYYELRTYNLSHNLINVLKDQQLQWSTKFPKLELFDLSYNRISKLYRFAVPLHLGTDRITTINLQHNEISAITVNDLDSFKEMPMMFIDLRNNPIDCNCSDSMTQLLKYISEKKHLQISSVSDYSYIGRLQCQGPEQLHGKTLETLTADMICEPVIETEYFLVPIICLSVAIVILAILLIIILRFRQEITIILFTRFNIIIPCQTRESYDSNKKYDAFVSYSSNEEEYVEKLFEDLEEPEDKSRPTFKFCMHHRDFIPGRTIFDNVTHSVESSRHTIILLSNHFIKSEFCLYEFQEAFRQSIMEKRRHLVIVMMEDIPEERLPRDLRRCVKTFTYIRKDDFLFTERLIYALSIKHKGKTVNKSHSITKESKVDNVKVSDSVTNIDLNKTLPIVKIQSCNNIETSKTKNKSDLCDKVESSFTNLDIVYSENKEHCDNKTNKTENRLQKYKKKLLKNKNGKLELNIKRAGDSNLSPIERKLNNKDMEFDRSLSLISEDTGYGSDRSSLEEKPSPEIAIDMGDFPPQAVIC